MRARTYNQSHVARSPHRRATHQHLLDVELSLGSATGSGRDVQPLLHHDRGPQRRVARLRDAGVRRGELPAGHRGHTGALPPFHPGVPGAGRGSHRAPRGRLPAHRPSRLQAADRRTRAGRHRHAHGVRPRPSAVRTRSRTRRDRGDHRMAQQRRHLPAAGAPPRCRLHRRLCPAADRIRTPRRPRSSLANNDSASTPDR